VYNKSWEDWTYTVFQVPVLVWRS